MKHIDYVNLAMDSISGGQSAVAKKLEIAQASVWKWTKKGLPRTDWTGEPNYSQALEELSSGKVTRKQLLESRNAN